MSVFSPSNADITNRLGKLAEFYQQGQASDLAARTLEKLIAYEAGLALSQLEELQKDLTSFETRYSMSSAQFYQAYQAGRTDDRMDFVEWASLVQMHENLQRRVQLLTGGEAS